MYPKYTTSKGWTPARPRRGVEERLDHKIVRYVAIFIILFIAAMALTTAAWFLGAAHGPTW